MKLWIDDIRTPLNDDYVWAKSSDQAISMLKLPFTVELLTEVSFDHDLGGDDTTRAVVLWMIEHNVWPKVAYVHTANPIGRQWLVGMLKRYGPDQMRVVE